MALVAGDKSPAPGDPCAAEASELGVQQVPNGLRSGPWDVSVRAAERTFEPPTPRFEDWPEKKK